MAVYEYKCECGHSFSKLQPMSAKKIATCPKCDCSAKRMISCGAGIIFKGSGFPGNDMKKARSK